MRKHFIPALLGSLLLSTSSLAQGYSVYTGYGLTNIPTPSVQDTILVAQPSGTGYRLPLGLIPASTAILATSNTWTGVQTFAPTAVAAPVAIVEQFVPSVITGTSNIVGANTTVAGSQGTGTGVGGSLVFQTAPAGGAGAVPNALITALTIDSTQAASFTKNINLVGSVAVNGAAGTDRLSLYQTGGLSRWALKADSVAEGGANAGSNLDIVRYNDAGSSLDIPLSVNRSTGLMTLIDGLSVTGAASFGSIPTHPTATPGDNTTQSATTAFVTAAVAASGGATQRAQFQYQLASGSNSTETSISATTWTQRILNTTVLNTIAGASLASNQVTLPAGTYQVVSVQDMAGNVSGSATVARLRNITDATTAINGTPVNTGATIPAAVPLDGVFTLAGAKVMEIDIYAKALSNGGIAVTSGEPEVYVNIVILKIG